MKKLRPWILLAFALPVALWATQEGVVFRDNQENMVVRYLSSWIANQVNADTVKFRGEGNPFQGTWKSQGMEVRAKRIDGTAMRSKQGAYKLRSALLSGGVTVILKSADSGVTNTFKSPTVDFTQSDDEGVIKLKEGVTGTTKSGGKTTKMSANSGIATIEPLDSKSNNPVRTITLTGDATVITTEGTKTTRVTSNQIHLTNKSESASVDLTGSPRIVFTDSNKDQVLTMTGSKGSASIASLGSSSKDPLRGARLDGPVTLVMDTKMKAEDGSLKPAKITGRAKELIYDKERQVIELRGDVRIDGNLPTMDGVSLADIVILKLDANQNVTEIEFRGSPGKSTMQEVKDDE
ncbi:MAG: hypothetical protein JNM04_07820 [Chthonomonas sp.]|nr:hypothetical protein [Chthonomonas sp.]